MSEHCLPNPTFVVPALNTFPKDDCRLTAVPCVRLRSLGVLDKVPLPFCPCRVVPQPSICHLSANYRHCPALPKAPDMSVIAASNPFLFLPITLEPSLQKNPAQVALSSPTA